MLITILISVLIITVSLIIYNMRTPIQFIRAAGKGDTNKVSSLIERGVNLNSKNFTETTALTNAVRAGHANIVRILLDKGAKVDFGDSALRGAFWVAASNGHHDVLKLLLENRVAPNIDYGGISAIEAAAELYHTPVVELLLNKGVIIDSDVAKQKVQDALKSRYPGNCDLCNSTNKNGISKDFVVVETKTVASMNISPVGAKMISSLVSYTVKAEKPIFICNDCINSSRNSYNGRMNKYGYRNITYAAARKILGSQFNLKNDSKIDNITGKGLYLETKAELLETLAPKNN